MCFLLPSTADFWVVLSLDMDLFSRSISRMSSHLEMERKVFIQSIYHEHVHVFAFCKLAQK